MGTTRKIISLFSEAGGMDIGFEEAGFEVAVAVEVDSACCETLRANRPALKIINKSIVDVSGEEILHEASLGGARRRWWSEARRARVSAWRADGEGSTTSAAGCCSSTSGS